MITITTVEDAQDAGFTGLLPIAECIRKGLPSGEPPSSTGGVYLLCSSPGFRPEFIPPQQARNVCRPWSVDCLANKWVDGVDVLYIGKGKNVRRRLQQLLRHAQGRAVNHTGGEIIWQLRGAKRLLLCWRSYQNPEAAEASLIHAFSQAAQGSLPFANRDQPRMMP